MDCLSCFIKIFHIHLSALFYKLWNRSSFHFSNNILGSKRFLKEVTHNPWRCRRWSIFIHFFWPSSWNLLIDCDSFSLIIYNYSIRFPFLFSRMPVFTFLFLYLYKNNPFLSCEYIILVMQELCLKSL